VIYFIWIFGIFFTVMVAFGVLDWYGNCFLWELEDHESTMVVLNCVLKCVKLVNHSN